MTRAEINAARQAALAEEPATVSAVLAKCRRLLWFAEQRPADLMPAP